MPRTASEVLRRQKCEKCLWNLANLQCLGTPRKPADWNRSPAPPPPISPSAVAPARDHGEKLPISDCWGHAPRRGIWIAVGWGTRTIGLAMAYPAGYGAARSREAYARSRRRRTKNMAER